MKQRQRPTAITVIAWILIVINAVSLITNTLMLNNPVVEKSMEASPIPLFLQYVMAYVGLSAMLLAGLGILRGKNWARLMYVIWAGVGSLVSLVTAPSLLLIPGTLIYLAFSFFLFRPKVNAYFTKRAEGMA